MKNININLNELAYLEQNLDHNYLAKKKAFAADLGHSTIFTAMIEGSRTVVFGTKFSRGQEDFFKILDSAVITGDLFGQGENRDACTKRMFSKFLASLPGPVA